VKLVEQLRAPSDPGARISAAEYARLLGYPAGHPLTGAIARLAEQSRDWYRRNGRPWVFAREVEIERIDGAEIELTGGETLDSAVLARRLVRASAGSLIVAAVSAGPQVDDHSATLWREDRSDKAFFLDRFGAAVAEHLARLVGDELRSAAGDRTVLPGYSPGYDGWRLEQQHRVHALLTTDPHRPLPGPLELLESGMLTPKSSLLAVFGTTRDMALAAAAWERNLCSWCSLRGCDFRAVPR
jgi:hypothetical protein